MDIFFKGGHPLQGWTSSSKADILFKIGNVLSPPYPKGTHIKIDTFDREISYKDLSTGQRKSLDLAIVFGILQNIIANVNFNLFCLDELFSNMDADSRNTMLALLNDSMAKDRTIFVINHAEMNDDYFSHKIKVRLENKKITVGTGKKEKEFVVKSSKYEKVF